MGKRACVPERSTPRVSGSHFRTFICLPLRSQSLPHEAASLAVGLLEADH